MALLNREDSAAALTRLGQLAEAHGIAIELLLVGGGIMVMEFNARPSTRDLDVVVLKPSEASIVRNLAAQIAQERGWPGTWLNDAVKGFLVGSSPTTPVLSAPGIRVVRPALQQLLAMKLCAWRDDVDIADARRLLSEMQGQRDAIWESVQAHLQPGRELIAQYAFDDLWEERHGKH